MSKPSEHPTPISYPETRSTVWLKSLGMFLVGVASVIITGIAIYVQWSNSKRDIELKQRAELFQEKSDAGRLAASLIPFIKCQDELQRTAALQLLAPEHANPFGAEQARLAELFAEVIANECKNLTPQSQTNLKQFQQQTNAVERMSIFQRTLANAWDFKYRGFDGPASRLFNRASNQVPPDEIPKINSTLLAQARKAFADGSFSKAADLFEDTFKALPSPLP